MTGTATSYLPLLITRFLFGAGEAGGAASDALVRTFGLTTGWRASGVVSFAGAGLLTIGAMITRQQLPTVVLLSLAYGATTFQRSGVFGVCLDIGREHAGAMVGMMNTAAQVGGLLGSVLYGYIVDYSGNDNAPFVTMAGLLFIGALLWLKIDASTKLGRTAQFSSAM